ncbi:hypothetical protein [Butyrivibrio sp. MC2021]|uniref:hypothetical protein n=1 Tax=Butyrivibrio sp. MC2021 TaxID=1408306 RepID=UPI00047AE453|nr:hypothetical protein [Butyrivibrio sp. MC2021]
MLLIKKDLVTSKIKFNIVFEKVAEDLLMISLVNPEFKGIPSHWRLTNVVGIPPLELGIDCQDGFISDATFFVDGLTIKKGEDISIPSLDGNIIVDTSIFTKVNDYIDVNQSYDIYYCENKLICSFDETKEIVNSFRNDRVEIFVDSNDQIIGFSICDLSIDEKNLINSITMR